MSVPPHALCHALASDHLADLLSNTSPYFAACERERQILANLVRLTYDAFPCTYKCFYHTTAQQWVLQRREKGLWTGHAVEELYTTTHALVQALVSAHTRPGIQDARVRTRLRALATDMLARREAWLPLFQREAFHEVTPKEAGYPKVNPPTAPPAWLQALKARKASRASCPCVLLGDAPPVEPECVRLAKAMARRRRAGQTRVSVRRSVRQADLRKKRQEADAARRKSQRAERVATARWGRKGVPHNGKDGHKNADDDEDEK